MSAPRRAAIPRPLLLALLLSALSPVLHPAHAFPRNPRAVRLGVLQGIGRRGVAGTVFAKDSRTLVIEGFTFDGAAPAARFWLDRVGEASAAGVRAVDAVSCADAPLQEYTAQDVVVELPPGTRLGAVSYFSIWDELAEISFGGLTVDPGKVAALPDGGSRCVWTDEGVQARKVRIGRLSAAGGDGAAGVVFALDSRTLRVTGFVYDGEGHDATFWVGTGTSDGTGSAPLFRQGCSKIADLSELSGSVVDLELPGGLELSEIDYLAVWSDALQAVFGSMAIDAIKLDGVPRSQGASCSARDRESRVVEPFPVQEKYNCEQLSDDFQVRWAVVGAKLDVELVGRIDEAQYMGFGPSGRSDRTSMIGSDVVVAFRKGNKFFATDYFWGAQSPCTEGKGVCPDEGVLPRGGENDVSKVSGEEKGGLTVVRYTRPLTSNDELDKPIRTSGPSFVSWAIGPLDPTLNLPQLRRGLTSFPSSNVEIEFGRFATNNCKRKLTVAQDDGDEKVSGFKRPAPGQNNGGNKVGKCEILFKGNKTTFDGCRKGLDGDFDLYWKIRDADREIDTLFRAPSKGGYVGFGWGYSEMVKSHAVIAFAGRGGIGVIESYSMESKSSAGVRPSDALKLVKKDVEIEGDFVSGMFTRKLKVGGIPSISREKTSAIWAIGPRPDSPKRLEYHEVRAVGVFDLSAPAEDGDASQEDIFPTSEEDIMPTSEEDAMPTSSSEDLEEDDDGVVINPEDNRNCTVTFKGTSRSYSGCVTDLSDGLEVYWELREEDQELDTLFRAPTKGGYIGFGWGLRAMTNSHVVVAYEDTSGNGVIDTYFLSNKSSEGVRPNETFQLVAKDVEVVGDFVTGMFTRKLEIEGLPTIASGSTSAIWAIGPQPKSPDSLEQHSSSAASILEIKGPSVSPDGVGDGTVSTESDASSNCTVSFKDDEMIFEGCRKNLTHGVEVYWRIREDEGEIDTLFRARTDGYIGFGWGYSEMIGSNAVIAMQDSNGNLKIEDYAMKSKTSAGVQPENKQDLKNKQVALDGEFLAGMFTRRLEIDSLPTITKGETDAIWAVGVRPRSEKDIPKHVGQAFGRIDLSQSTGIVEGGGASTFFIVHGVLMAVAWFVLTPTAIISMRYLKAYNPVTFEWHRALNLLSVAFVIAGFIMGLVRGSRQETGHLILGCLVFSFAILQVLGGILRPGKDAKVRMLWSFVHMLSGYVTYGIGMANVWVGLRVIGAAVGYYIACGVLVGVYVCAHVFFSLQPDKFPVRGLEAEEPFPPDEPPRVGEAPGPDLT